MTSTTQNLDPNALKTSLDPVTFNVTQKKGTEPPYSGKYVDETSDGMYHCIVCGNQLFSSDTKFTTNLEGLKGWPSFEAALPGSVKFVPDDSFGMRRTEVVCAKCGSHLGHVFDDKTETESGKHFCINSCALNLEKARK